jgi:hypothetical protein
VDGASFVSKGQCSFTLRIAPSPRIKVLTGQTVPASHTHTHMHRRELTDRHSLNREKYILLLWKADRPTETKIAKVVLLHFVWSSESVPTRFPRWPTRLFSYGKIGGSRFAVSRDKRYSPVRRVSALSWPNGRGTRNSSRARGGSTRPMA